MKKSSVILMIVGFILLIVGNFIFNNLNYINAVDAKPLAININGIKSFPWVSFTGGVILVIGMLFYIANIIPKGRRFD